MCSRYSEHYSKNKEELNNEFLRYLNYSYTCSERKYFFETFEAIFVTHNIQQRYNKSEKRRKHTHTLLWWKSKLECIIRRKNTFNV